MLSTNPATSLAVPRIAFIAVKYIRISSSQSWLLVVTVTYIFMPVRHCTWMPNTPNAV